MADWLAEAWFVLRGWRRTPGVSLTIVLTLVLGLGLASAIFAFADGYLFRPLPFPGADQTYFVGDPHNSPGMLHATDTDALRHSAIANLGFVEWGAGARLAASAVLIDGRSVPFYAQAVSPGFRRTVALPLLAGRDFTDDDHRASDPTPGWLSYRFWTVEFNGDRNVIGRTLPAADPAGPRLLIVGILAPAVSAFDLNNTPPDAIVPAVPPATIDPRRLSDPIVRLPDGMTREQATTLITGALQALAPVEDGRPRAVNLTSLTENQTRGGRPTARVLFTAAMLVLALATINLIHLLLARGVARAPEVATRAALGASRWRVARLFLTESALIGAVGSAGGLALGAGLSRLIESLIPRYPTAGRNMALVPMLFDVRVVVFAAVLGVIIVIAGGLWPAWRALRRPLGVNARSVSGLTASIPARLSRAMLASELAVATIVMLGTVFIGTGIWRYLHQPLNFDYVDRYSVAITRADRQPILPTDFDGLRRAVADVAAVHGAGPRYLAGVTDIDVPGRALAPRAIVAQAATAGYFETWAPRLAEGRWFSPPEFIDGAALAVVDRKTASVAWPGADAIGQDIRVNGVLRRVVGIIEPLRGSLMHDNNSGVVYVPSTQVNRYPGLTVWAPTTPYADLAARLGPAVNAILPGAQVQVSPITFNSFFLREVGEADFQGPIMLVFGVLAFVLAGIGVFGLVTYVVGQRTREFGIRLALGARAQNIWRLVIGQSVVPAIVGLVMGVGGASALETLVRATLFGWSSSIPGTTTAVALAIILVAVVAAMPPARRAMRIDPATTLRSE